MKKDIVLFCSIIFFWSCRDNNSIEPANDFGYSYFPTTLKSYVIYSVDSIVHNDFTQTIDTFKYQLKEVIDTSFLDNSNRPNISIKRYKKNYNPSLPYDSMPWIFINVWYANRTNLTAERVEENTRFIKLNFPIEARKQWNGNAYNTLGEQNYTYTDINKFRQVNGLSYDSTLLVTQQNSENLIEKKYYIEVYAKNIGLINKQIIDVSSNAIRAGVPLMNRITSGLQYKQTLISFGTE